MPSFFILITIMQNELIQVLPNMTAIITDTDVTFCELEGWEIRGGVKSGHMVERYELRGYVPVFLSNLFFIAGVELAKQNPLVHYHYILTNNNARGEHRSLLS